MSDPLKERPFKAQEREHVEPTEGNFGVPVIVQVMIAVLIAWGVYYYIAALGLPTQGGDRRTAVVAVEQAASGSVSGEKLYAAHCSACHQGTGTGIPGAFPPLAGSEWLLDKPDYGIMIAHDGLHGAITVAGNAYNGVMPGLSATLSNEEIAAILTYARSSWGNDAEAVTAEQVEQHVQAYPDHGSWTAEELIEAFGAPAGHDDAAGSSSVEPAAESSTTENAQVDEQPTDDSMTEEPAVASVSGEAVYAAQCVACHQGTGAGIPGAFPPLDGSEWVVGDKNFGIAAVHDGLSGEIVVGGNTFNSMMPPLGQTLSSQEIAAVLTYVRSAWSNDADEVTADDVEQFAQEYPGHAFWSAEELIATFGEPQ